LTLAVAGNNRTTTVFSPVRRRPKAIGGSASEMHGENGSQQTTRYYQRKKTRNVENRA
jgi:hypothetical protein